MRFPIMAAWVLAASALAAEPATLRIVPSEDSRLALEVGKTGLLSGKKHIFEFSRYSGEVIYDTADLDQSRVRFTVESASTECKDNWGGEKQRKKVEDYALNKMMAADRFPELVFASTLVTKKSETEFEVQGTLTIRDITKPIVINVSAEPEPDGRVVFTGQGIVKMKDYGLKPPKAALGLIGTKNKMLVTFRLVAAPPADTETS